MGSNTSWEGKILTETGTSVWYSYSLSHFMPEKTKISPGYVCHRT